MSILHALLISLCLTASAQADALSHASAERVAEGLSPLTFDPRLAFAAQDQANHMARTGRVGHDGHGGSSVFERVRGTGVAACFIAENVAAGQRLDRAVIRDWMRSPGHRANILNRDVESGAVASARGRNGRLYWAMVLAGRC